MIGTWRVCGTAAGIAPRLIHCGDAEPAGQLDHVGGECLPAVVGLGPDEHEQVAFVEPCPAQDELGQVSSVSRPSTISSGGRRAR